MGGKGFCQPNDNSGDCKSIELKSDSKNPQASKKEG